MEVRIRTGNRFKLVDHLIRMTVFGALLACFASSAFSQGPDDAAPPPLKMLSKTEKALLTEKPEPKQRTVLTLELMDARLRSAEKFRIDENYSLMYAELGGFQALMDNTLNFLLRSNANEGKQLNSLKRFEIGLRRFAPRVETIRREVPVNFEPYVKDLIRYMSDAREKAIQPFFSDSVVSN